MAKLTKRAIDAATYTGTDNARCVLWDEDPPGFGLRLFRSGKRSFVLSYRVNTRKRLLTLGAYGALTLDQARKLARRELARVETGNADPLEERQKATRGATVADLCTAYMERHGNAKKSGGDDQRRIDRDILPAWRNLKAAAINAEPNQSARFGLWLYLLTGARKSEILKARWDDVDETRGILRLADTKAGGTHYIPLSGAALALLREIPRQHGNPYILPGSGPRGATAEAKANMAAPLVNITKPWDRVRTAATLASWRQEPEVAALIDRLTEARAATKSKHAAKDRTPSPTLAEIRKAAAAEALDLPPAIDDVRLHDLRRTVGSWLAQAGNSLHLIGRVLNHSNASTTQVYARFGEDTVRTALEQHGERIMGAAGLVPTAEVVTLAADRCGTCVYWAEDARGSQFGGCICPRSRYNQRDWRALAEACDRYRFDDEAPELATRQAAVANG